MDARFTPCAADSERQVAVWLYPRDTDFLSARSGTVSERMDLAPFATRIEQQPDQLVLGLAWHNELYAAAEPRPGQIVAVELNGRLLWMGVIESRHDYRLEVGTRTMNLTARSRDASPAWRCVRRSTEIYPTGTAFDTILRDLATALGLSVEDEYLLPPIPAVIVQDNVQLAEMTGWGMLETLLLPNGYSPFIDGLGRLRACSREIGGRNPDITVPAERVIAVTGSRARAPISAMRIKWLDPNLTKVTQAQRVLVGANITAGYFQTRQTQAVFWSDDRTQRAENTSLVVKQSANSGILPVCEETYQETSHTSGVIVLETKKWVPGLLGVFAAVKVAGALPDIAPPFGGPTTPVGKMAHAALEFSVLMVIASIGTGVYEIWGAPYDFVHARHTTEAYNPGAPAWQEDVEILETDLLSGPEHARSLAARELIYRTRKAQTYGVTLIDDPRIEPGDLLGLPDGSRLYVTSYQRALGRDAPALLEVEGFQA